jgi:hypothetical protein
MFLFGPYFRCKQEKNQENQAVAWFLKTKEKIVVLFMKF